MIKTLAELRATRVFAFPTRRKMFAAAVRTDGSILAVDKHGHYFYSGFNERRGRTIGTLAPWQAERIIAGLKQLGDLDPAMADELAFERAAEKRRDEAGCLLNNFHRLEKLGCPYTEEQMQKLRTIRDER